MRETRKTEEKGQAKITLTGAIDCHYKRALISAIARALICTRQLSKASDDASARATSALLVTSETKAKLTKLSKKLVLVILNNIRYKLICTLYVSFIDDGLT